MGVFRAVTFSVEMVQAWNSSAIVRELERKKSIVIFSDCCHWLQYKMVETKPRSYMWCWRKSISHTSAAHTAIFSSSVPERVYLVSLTCQYHSLHL